MDIEQAKQELAKAPLGDEKSSKERLRLLLLHSKNFYRNAPKESEKWARQALKLAKKLKDREGIARAHYTIGAAKYQLSEYDEAEKEFRTAMELDDPKKFQEALLERPIFSLGLTLSKRGKFREAIGLYEKALAISREHQRKSEIDILGALGNAALEQGDYPKALEYQYASLAILDKQDDPLRRSVVFANIGRIYLDVQFLDKAENFFELSYNIKKDINDITGLCNTAFNRGIIAQKQNNLEIARQHYRDALQLAKMIGRIESESYIEDSIGTLELQEHNSEAALSSFSRSIQIASSIHFQYTWCAGLIGKGRALLALNKLTEAIEALKETLIMCEESEFLPLECEATSILAKAYEAKGKMKESVEYFNKFIKLNAEVNNEQKQRALVEISARVEIEKADRERARMEQLAKDADQRSELLRYETERQSKELTTLALQLVERNEFLCNLKEAIEPQMKSTKKAKEIAERIDAHIKSDRDWETFEHQFDSIHREFLKKVAAAYPTLTPMEMRVAVLIKLNLSTKAIASLLCLSTRTVENHRQALRRKMGLHSEGNLVAFLTSFGEAK